MQNNNSPDDLIYVMVSEGLQHQHLELFNEPPNFRFEDLNQICFVGNINGGDTIMFRNVTELNTWLVAHDLISMNELDNRIESEPIA